MHLEVTVKYHSLIRSWNTVYLVSFSGMVYFAFSILSLAESSNGCSIKHKKNKVHPRAYKT